MKRILTILITLLLCTTMVGCSSKKEEDTSKEDSSVEVDKGLLNVTITLDKDFVESIAGESPEEYVESIKDQDYFSKASTKLNDDGSVSITMSRSDYNKMLEEMAAGLKENLQEIVDDNENYPNITAIDTNADFTEFKVTCSTQNINLSESFMVLGFYMLGCMYQMFTEDPVYSIHIVYQDTEGNIISDDTYDESTFSGETTPDAN